MLMSGKCKLPVGIYVNEEYPIDIKKTRDRLRPILKLAKSKPEYCEKSRMENDKLVTNGIKYSWDDPEQLPPDLAPYKVAEKSNDHHIAFQGALSPYSNFHHS